jgi:hypothetical protein
VIVTSSTRAFAAAGRASALPCTCVGNEAGSQASTTSVPLRGAVTMVSDAPMRSARSCMLVMPKPVPRARGECRVRRPATEMRSPTDCTVEARIVILPRANA